MYGVIADPYCYPGTTVLINKLNIRNQEQLDAFEAEIVSERSSEPFPNGRLSASHYLAYHKHLFQDVYPWAGKPRTVRITKGASTFCYPENIQSELRKLFGWLRDQDFLRGLSKEEFACQAAHFLGELNAIHPFREGNGRTQLSFMDLLANQADHPLDLERLDPTAFLGAMVASFAGDETPLADQLLSILA